MESNKNINTVFIYGIADFKVSKIIILNEPSDNGHLIEDISVINPINFDQLIGSNNKLYISYITISGIRRYSLIEDNGDEKVFFDFLDENTYKWNIFKIYKTHYIDNYIKPKEINNIKSLSPFINTLHINLQPKPLCLCAQFVHWALNVAGFKFQGKYSAKLYHMEGLLNELGFKEIPPNSELRKGDIIVIVIDNLKNESNYYGHICAWDGNFWLCDEKREKINYMDKSHLYRYDSWDE